MFCNVIVGKKATARFKISNSNKVKRNNNKQDVQIIVYFTLNEVVYNFLG